MLLDGMLRRESARHRPQGSDSVAGQGVSPANPVVFFR